MAPLEAATGQQWRQCRGHGEDTFAERCMRRVTTREVGTRFDALQSCERVIVANMAMSSVLMSSVIMTNAVEPGLC